MDEAPTAEMLVELDETELLLRIANTLGGEQAFPLPKRDLIALARQWLEMKRKHLAALLCHNEKVRAFADKEHSKHERIAMIVEVASIITGTIQEVTPVVVAALLVRVGFKQLCEKEWERGSS